MSKTKKAITLLLSAAVLFCALLAALQAPAAGNRMNEDYLERNKWYHNEKVQSVPFQSSSAKDAVAGTLYYVTDGNLCLYTDIVLNRHSGIDDLSEARVIYRVTTERESYAVCVDAGGINTDDTGEAEQRLFSVRQNFDEAGNGEFISALEYLGQEKACLVEVVLFFRMPHLLTEKAIALSALPDETQPCQSPVTQKQRQTTRRQATAAKSPDKTTAQDSTAARNGGSTASAGKTSVRRSRYTSRSGAAATTKFVPSLTEEDAQTITEPEPETAASGGVITAAADYRESYRQEKQGRTVMSTGAKILLACGAAIGIAGIAATALAALSGRYRLVRRTEDEKKEETSEAEKDATSSD